MSYLTEDSKYLLNNISSLCIGGYLKDRNDFKLSIILNDRYKIIQDNIDGIKAEIAKELPPTWFNKFSFYGSDFDNENKMKLIIIKFKK